MILNKSFRNRKIVLLDQKFKYLFSALGRLLLLFGRIEVFANSRAQLFDGLRLIDEVGEPNVLLQFDAYHVQRMEGDPATRLRPLLDRVGHVQVADNPGRHQPGTGEIDFDALFGLLDDTGYTGAIGLEYVPAPDTSASLSWLERYGFVPSQRS